MEMWYLWMCCGGFEAIQMDCDIERAIAIKFQMNFELRENARRDYLSYLKRHTPSEIAAWNEMHPDQPLKVNELSQNRVRARSSSEKKYL